MLEYVGQKRHAIDAFVSDAGQDCRSDCRLTIDLQVLPEKEVALALKIEVALKLVALEAGLRRGGIMEELR